MTTTILLRHRNRRTRSTAGLTLVEVLIATTLAGVIMLAVITGFLFLGRTGTNLQNYVDMEVQARRAIGMFGDDARTAVKASWTDSNTLVLAVKKSNGSTSNVTYSYDSTTKRLNRTEGTSTVTLLSGISTFTFKAYNQNATDLRVEDATTSGALQIISNSTKQVQLSLRMIRSNRTVTDATNAVISARFIMRNKTDVS